MIYNALDEMMLLETCTELIDEGCFASSILDSCEIFMEAYRGKHPELIKAENLLDEICSEIINNKKSMSSLSYSRDSRVNDIEKCLSKVFNTKKMELFIYDDIISNTLVGVNGFTIPQALCSFGPAENGLTKDLSIYVSVSQRLIAKLGLTGGETLAIILHEIGHNVRKDWLRNISDIIKVGFNPLTMGLTLLQIPQQLYIAGPKSLDSSTPKPIRDVVKTVNSVKNFIESSIMYPIVIDNIMKILKDPTLILLNMDPSSYLTGYVEEKYADSLPTSYGYGYEMAMVAAKFSDFSKSGFFAKPSPISIIEDFIVRTSRIIMSPIGVHPDDSVRLISQVKNMKKHLKDPSITPQQREELERSLELTEEYIENVYKNPRHAKNLAAPFTYLWNMLSLSVKGAVDPRELLNLLRLEE